MSADRHSKSGRPSQWGRGPPGVTRTFGEREDTPTSSSSPAYTRYRPYPSTGRQPNRGSRLSYDGEESHESQADSYRPTNRTYNTSYRPSSTGSYKEYQDYKNSPYSSRASSKTLPSASGASAKETEDYSDYYKDYRKYPDSYSSRGSSNNDGSYSSYKSSTRGRGGGGGYYSSRYGRHSDSTSSGSGYKPNYNEHSYHYRKERFGGNAERDDGKPNFRTNPEETSDHYYPQRDRRSNLISSKPSTSFPNRVENARQSEQIKDRSVSPLNADSYSERKPTEGYQRKSRPSLIPSSFKDDEQNDEEYDDYELEEALKELPTPVIRKDSQDKSAKDDNEVSTEEQQSTVIQDRISEQIPLTTEHKEELDESAEKTGTATRESSEESAYEPAQIESKEPSPSIVPKKEESEDTKKDQNEEDKDIEMHDAAVVEEEAKSDDDSEVENGEADTATEVLKADDIPSVEKKTAQVEEEVQKKVIKEQKPIIPLHAIDSCIFPMQRAELRVWELKNHPREDIIESSPYLLKRPIKSFNDYPFFERNLLVHEQGFKLRLLEKLSVLKGITFDHKISLWNEYSHRGDDWNERCAEMDSQLKELYPQQDGETEEIPQQDTGSEQTQSSGRRGRYHGDTVRSEAEFLEILKGLEKEKEEDPVYKAELLAAKIPDMILNPVEKNLRVIEVNNLVLDKEEWAKRINTDPVDTFTKHEHELFCEGFLSFPKRFGRISAAMGGLRTPEECVLHYYKTKKSLTDYKQLLASKKKRNRKGKNNRRISRSKNATATNTSAPNTPTVETPVDSGDEKELGLENFIPKEAVTEEVYTETGRRRRAAAPVFDSTKGTKSDQELKEEEERKRSIDNASSNETQDEDSSKGKLPVKKKARIQKPKRKEEIKPEIPIVEQDDKGARVITSYWSVKDINLFASLIGSYGTQWALISDKMKSKSTTMVRNYYLKNADSHGWRAIAEAADRKNESYPLYTTQSNDFQRQQEQQQQQNYMRKPPLGVFSSHGDLPSNVNISGQVKHEPSLLPSVKTLAPFPQPSMSLQPQGYQQQPVEPILPPTGGSTSRSNPFSITSLLNPSEDTKPPQPTPVAAPNPQIQNEREIYSSYRTPASSGGSNVMSMLNNDEPKPFNPLSTLVAAASDNGHRTDSWNQQPPILRNGASSTEQNTNFGYKPYGYTNGTYGNGQNLPLYQGGYRAPYSQNTEGSRDIFNQAPPAPQTSSTGSGAPLPSNFIKES